MNLISWMGQWSFEMTRHIRLSDVCFFFHLKLFQKHNEQMETAKKYRKLLAMVFHRFVYDL